MADVAISGLTALGAAPATTDLIPLVDVSDTTQALTGTTKKMTVTNLFTAPHFTTPVVDSGGLTVTLGGITVTGTSTITGVTTIANTTTSILALDTNTGATSDVAYVRFQRAGAVKWQVGTNLSGAGTDAFEIFNTGTTAALSVSKSTSAVTLGGTLTAVGARPYRATSVTNAAAAQTGTLTNAPTAGNPAFWIPVNINGTDYCIPAWVG